MIVSLAARVTQYQLDVSQPPAATKPVQNAFVVLILFGVALLLIVAIRFLIVVLARAFVALIALVVALFVVLAAAALTLTNLPSGPASPGPPTSPRPTYTLLAPGRSPGSHAQRTRPPAPGRTAPSPSPDSTPRRTTGPAVLAGAGR
jgi:hypothetical protein